MAVNETDIFFSAVNNQLFKQCILSLFTQVNLFVNNIFNKLVSSRNYAHLRNWLKF